MTAEPGPVNTDNLSDRNKKYGEEIGHFLDEKLAAMTGTDTFRFILMIEYPDENGNARSLLLQNDHDLEQSIRLALEAAHELRKKAIADNPTLKVPDFKM
jgi:hypothetical protein